MIFTILLMYVGIQISAPWWYFALLAVFCFVNLLNAGIKLGKKVGEKSDD